MAHLLEEYFHIKSDKTLQQADWRRRPLTEEQIQYAKMDVHYLLCLEDILKNELISEDNLTSSRDSRMTSYSKAVQKSNDLALNLFKKISSKDAATAASLQLIRKLHDANGKHDEQDSCLRSTNHLLLSAVYALCLWRDRIARKEDESTEYILPNKILLVLAQQRPNCEEELLDIVQSTPTFDFGSSSTEPTYWKPPSSFHKEVSLISES